MKETKLKVFLSETKEPLFNIAVEDWIVSHIDSSFISLFLWESEPSLVLGKYQDPQILRVDAESLGSEDIALLPRPLGGAAAYYQAGTSNFAIVGPRSEFSPRKIQKLFVEVLRQFNLDTAISGAHDIVIGTAKIGSLSWIHREEQTLCFGKIFIDADLEKASQIINTKRSVLETVTQNSDIDRLSNVIEFHPSCSHQSLISVVVGRFFKTYKAECSVERLAKEKLEDLPSLSENYHKLGKWIFSPSKPPEGSFPARKRFSWGELTLHILSEDKRIKDLHIYTDAVIPELIFDIQDRLLSKEGQEKDISAVFKETAEDYPDFTGIVNDFYEWLKELLGWRLT